MPDQSSSNANRISAMLQDLAAARAKAGQGAPPVNLPTSPIPIRPTPSNPAPIRPSSPAPAQPPPISPPMPKIVTPMPGSVRVTPGTAIPPRPTSPPPSPRPVPTPSAPVVPRPAMPLPPPAPRPTSPPAPQPLAPSTPVQPSYTSELRTMKADIGQISTGQPPAGVTPQPTPASPAPAPSSVKLATPQIVVPAETTPSGGSRKSVYIIGLLVVAAVAYSVFTLLSRNSSPTVSQSPLPSISVSATPSLGKNLIAFFRQTIDKTADLKDNGTAKDDFLSIIATSQPPIKQALRVPVSGPFSTSLAEFLSGISTVIPADLKTALGSDWIVLTYGQSEQFDAQGQKITNSTTRPQVILVSVLQDVSQANQVMQSWENAGLDNLATDIFGFDKNKALIPEFSSGTYRQISIRYHNFPYADQSLDYAITLGSNGRNYLVIASSRESIFFAIDQLMQ